MYGYDYGYDYGSGMGFDTGAEVLLVPVIIGAVLSFVITIVLFISLIKIFTKAGKPWWAAIVPIYNIIVLMDIAELSYKNLLFILIPIVGLLIFTVKLYIGIAKRFNKGTGYAIGMLFLPIIFLPLLAFSKDTGKTGNNEVMETNNIVNDNMNQMPEANNFTTENVVSETKTVETIETNNAISDNNVETIEKSEPENSNIETFIPNNMNNQPVIEPDSTLNNMNVNNNVSSNFESLDINQINNNNETINAFNQTPTYETNVVNEVNNQIETFTVNEPVKEENVVIAPVETIETISEPVNEMGINEPVMNTTQGVNNTNTKYCKNCGTEMPKIVTICPTCGIDNE